MADAAKSNILHLKNVRLSYPKLFKAEQFDPSKADSAFRYSAAFHIDKKDPQVKAINDAVEAAVKAKFGDKAKAKLAEFKANPQKYCVSDGDFNEKAPGCFILSSHRQQKAGPPTVVDRNRAPLTEDSGKPYAGCYVNASVDIYAQDGQNGGIRCSLRGVQFVKDGEAFGGGRPASPDEFEPLEDDDFSDL